MMMNNNYDDEKIVVLHVSGFLSGKLYRGRCRNRLGLCKAIKMSPKAAVWPDGRGACAIAAPAGITEWLPHSL